MEKFTRFTARACPLPQANINTDQILPARYLKWPRSKGLGQVLFHDLRADPDGKPRTHFPLNQPIWHGAQILLAGRNFGGGSSREAAVYAIYDSGFRCVIAPSFGDIFAQNAVKNGLLTATVSESDHANLVATVTLEPQRDVTVDLQLQAISCANRTYNFSIDSISRNQLLNGWDDLDLTESYRERISAFCATDRLRRPWTSPETH